VCHRFPKLRFISVESGIGWLPFLLQSADYQYKAMAVKNARSDLQLLPSEYFRRQVYACCWFEHVPAEHVVQSLGADRIMFETDFPHPTSIYGPDVPATIKSSLGHLAPDVQRKILWSNCEKLYGIEAPAA
jgi:predicted TIM-barrel fold metal-dependent hydrolase